MYTLRWHNDMDMEQVVAIAQLNDVNAILTIEDFDALVSQRDIICYVAEEDNMILGFMIYQLYKHHIELLILEVHPDYKRKNFGTILLDKLLDKVSNHKTRRFIFSQLRESNLIGLQFAKNFGFTAISINKDAYENPDDDGIFLKLEVLKEKGGKCPILGDIVV